MHTNTTYSNPSYERFIHGDVSNSGNLKMHMRNGELLHPFKEAGSEQRLCHSSKWLKGAPAYLIQKEEQPLTSTVPDTSWPSILVWIHSLSTKGLVAWIMILDRKFVKICYNTPTTNEISLYTQDRNEGSWFTALLARTSLTRNGHVPTPPRLAERMEEP